MEHHIIQWLILLHSKSKNSNTNSCRKLFLLVLALQAAAHFGFCRHPAGSYRRTPTGAAGSVVFQEQLLQALCFSC